MIPPEAFLEAGTPAHEVEPGLWSVLPPDAAASSYDRVAASYDRLIGNRLYQRIAWGNDPALDLAFARRAAASGSGPFLDAGCGSLLFTAAAHRESERPTLLLDLSLGMLRRAKTRLEEGAGVVPSHVTLLQADLFATPLRPQAFETVLCPGILHLFERPGELLARLAAATRPDGQLFVSSLVTDRAFGRAYLRMLARSGEVGCQLSLEELLELARRSTGRSFEGRARGNMASVWSTGS